VAPTGAPVSFNGIAIWTIRDGRLAECWVKRAPGFIATASRVFQWRAGGITQLNGPNEPVTTCSITGISVPCRCASCTVGANKERRD